MSDVNSLIDNILAKDFTAAESAIGDLLGSRAGDALEQEKVNVASSLFDDVEVDDNDDGEEEKNEDV